MTKTFTVYLDSYNEEVYSDYEKEQWIDEQIECHDTESGYFEEYLKEEYSHLDLFYLSDADKKNIIKDFKGSIFLREKIEIEFHEKMIERTITVEI